MHSHCLFPVVGQIWNKLLALVTSSPNISCRQAVGGFLCVSIQAGGDLYQTCRTRTVEGETTSSFKV